MDLEPVVHSSFPNFHPHPHGRRAPSSPQPLRGVVFLVPLVMGIQRGRTRYLRRVLICMALVLSAGGPLFLRRVALCASGLGTCPFRALTRFIKWAWWWWCLAVGWDQLASWSFGNPSLTGALGSGWRSGGLCVQGGKTVIVRGAGPRMPVWFSREVS